MQTKNKKIPVPSCDALENQHIRYTYSRIYIRIIMPTALVSLIQTLGAGSLGGKCYLLSYFLLLWLHSFHFFFFRNPYFRLSKRKGLCLVGREIGWLFHATAIRKPRHSVLNCSRASLYISPPHTHGELYKYLWKKQHIFACLLCDFLLRCSWGAAAGNLESMNRRWRRRRQC